MEKHLLVDPKSKNEISVRIEQVDAHTAQQYLSRLPDHQRKLKPRLVKRYSEMMLAGQWQTLAAPVIFSDSTDGKKLIDGQHRLNAVIEAVKHQPNIKIPMLIIIGAPASTIYAIDDGVNRTLADAMEIHQHETLHINRQDYSHSIKQLLLLAYGAQAGASFRAMGHKRGGNNVALLAMSERIPQLSKKSKMFTDLFKWTNIKKLLGTSYSLPLFYFFEQVSHDVTYEIFKSLEYGTSIDSKGEYSPILAYIKWLEYKREHGIRYDLQTQIWGFIWCFEQAISGKKVKALRTDKEAVANFRFGENHIGADKIKDIAKSIIGKDGHKELKIAVTKS